MNRAIDCSSSPDYKKIQGPTVCIIWHSLRVNTLIDGMRTIFSNESLRSLFLNISILYHYSKEVAIDSLVV